uniref:Uncharacterized protein n=1 Tax=viral metagenome TaxID=1070528 RepID=A0A6C0B1R8_9ZZZZ
MGGSQSLPGPEYEFPTAMDEDISDYVSRECDVRNRNNWYWFAGTIIYRTERCHASQKPPKKAPTIMKRVCDIGNQNIFTPKMSAKMCYGYLGQMQKNEDISDTMTTIIPISIVVINVLVSQLKFDFSRSMFYSIFIVPALLFSPFLFGRSSEKIFFIDTYLPIVLLSLLVRKTKPEDLVVKAILLYGLFTVLSMYMFYSVFWFEAAIGEIMTLLGLYTGNRPTIMQSYWAQQARVEKVGKNSGRIVSRGGFGAWNLFNQQTPAAHALRFGLVGLLYKTGILDMLYMPLKLISHFELSYITKKFV